MEEENAKYLVLKDTVIKTNEILYCYNEYYSIVICFSNNLSTVINYEEEEEELYQKDFKKLCIALSGITDYIEIQKMEEKIKQIEEDLKKKYSAMYEEKCFNDKIEKVTLTDQKNYYEKKFNQNEEIIKEIIDQTGFFTNQKIKSIIEKISH